MRKLPSIALIHGWATESTIWDPVRAELESRGHRVTAYEMPGYGYRSSFNGTVTFSQLVADAMRHLEFHDILVGWSLGAMVALKAAARNNAACKAVFAVCPTAKFCCDVEKEAALNQLRLSVESDAERAASKFRRSMASPENRRAVWRTLKELHPSQPTGSPNNPPQEKGCVSKETLLAGLEILATTDLSNRLNRIKIPVRIVSGTEDLIIPCTSGKELHRQIAGSTYTTLPCGHVPFLECPQPFMELLFEFTQTFTGSSADSKPI